MVFQSARRHTLQHDLNFAFPHDNDRIFLGETTVRSDVVELAHFFGIAQTLGKVLPHISFVLYACQSDHRILKRSHAAQCLGTAFAGLCTKVVVAESFDTNLVLALFT